MCRGYWKGNFRVALDYDRQLYFFTIYIYIYIIYIYIYIYIYLRECVCVCVCVWGVLIFGLQYFAAFAFLKKADVEKRRDQEMSTSSWERKKSVTWSKIKVPLLYYYISTSSKMVSHLEDVKRYFCVNKKITESLFIFWSGVLVAKFNSFLVLWWLLTTLPLPKISNSHSKSFRTLTS